MLRKLCPTPALTIACLLLTALAAEAALFGVSGKPAAPGGPLTAIQAGGNPDDVQLNLANGFPLWYQDTAIGLKLEMCLEQNTGFCLTGEPFTRFPISFPSNFGAEQFYWTADAATTFRSTGDGPLVLRSLLLVSSLEAGFMFGFPAEGDQAVFARIRLRGDVPVAGNYLVEHPFGQTTFVVTPEAILLERAINETQDIGNILPPTPGNFLLALPDGPGPAEPVLPPLVPHIPKVDDLDRSIGPFVTWDTFNVNPALSDPLLRDATGNLYLGKPEQPGPIPGILVPLAHAIAGSPVGTNFFRITLQPDSPIFLTNPGFQLDAEGADGVADNTITLPNLVVMGKIFNDGANLAPVAHPDFAGGPAGAAIVTNVVANDVDVLPGQNPVPGDLFNPANTNVHDLNRQAISLDPLGGYRTTTTTLKGGTVTRETPFNTGLTSVRYQPAAGFTGIDTFQYLVQDTGGLLSQAAQVTVAVDDLKPNPISVRPKLMKWDIRGTSSLATLQTTDAVSGAPVFFTSLSGAQELPPTASVGGGEASISLRTDAVLGQVIDYTLSYRGLTTPVAAAHIHGAAVGSTGEANIFLCADTPPAGVVTPACPDTVGTETVTVTGTLSSADFVQATPAVADFTQLVAAIQAGGTYVNVQTTQFADGEIRGQLGRNVVVMRNGADLSGPVLGVAAVRDDLTWTAPAKLNLLPPQGGRISVQTSAGGQALNLPVQVK